MRNRCIFRLSKSGFSIFSLQAEKFCSSFLASHTLSEETKISQLTLLTFYLEISKTKLTSSFEAFSIFHTPSDSCFESFLLLDNLGSPFSSLPS